MEQAIEPEVIGIRGRSAEPTPNRWMLTVGSLACWTYVYLVFWLLLWILGTRLLFGWTPVVITSGSMSPAIKPGDVVMMGEPPDMTLKPGAVVAFEGPTETDSLVTHRIHAVEAGSYVTKGDANALPDSTPLAAGDVSGVGRLLVPMVGSPKAWLETGRSDLLAVWLLVSGVCLGLAMSSARKIRAEAIS
jgi:signal peptidase I